MVEPLATINWIAHVGVVACEVIVPPVIFTVWIPEPTKLKRTVEPDCVVVCDSVPPDIVKLPTRFIISVVG